MQQMFTCSEAAVPSLLDLDLEESEDEVEDCFISPEEIRQFQKQLPQLNTQREQLR